MTAPKTPTVPLEPLAERVAMAMAEAGYPVNVEVDPHRLHGLRWIGVEADLMKLDGLVAAWVKACSLVGLPARCVPCSLATVGRISRPGDRSPRVSPDCEGTGRCELP